MRIGFGSDTHRLVPGRKLLLGGVEIDAPFGEDAHSDGDVLLHAVIDGLLGAAGLGDIGDFFPPEEDTWKDADSRSLLSAVLMEVEQAGYRPVNIDVTISLQGPKIGPLKQKIRQNLAALFHMPVELVNVKAKTGEGAGPVGRGETVEAAAAVLLESPEPDIWV